MRVAPRESPDLRCAIRHAARDLDGRCDGCGAVFHRECREEVRRCPSVGCETRPRAAEVPTSGHRA